MVRIVNDVKSEWKKIAWLPLRSVLLSLGVILATLLLSSLFFTVIDSLSLFVIDLLLSFYL